MGTKAAESDVLELDVFRLTSATNPKESILVVVLPPKHPWTRGDIQLPVDVEGIVGMTLDGSAVQVAVTKDDWDVGQRVAVNAMKAAGYNGEMGVKVLY